MTCFDLDTLQQIFIYAKKRTCKDEDNFKKRKQTNKQKIFFDIFLGKVGEFFVYDFFTTEKNFIISQLPDLKLYEKSQKSFAADLVIIGHKEKQLGKNIRLQVKTISWESQQLYGKSFLVEKVDPIIKSQDENYFFVVVLQKQDLSFEAPRLLAVKDVKYRNPVRNLPSKLAVYLD